ncbi:MAG TPA: hypothetical protein VKE70_30095 [Candidatus Solibacter sp.]|nr:hypothetical protein [Candidatus Solibacter sp.]
MSYRHVASYAALAFSLLTTGIADTLTLKDGRTINGNYLGGTSRQVRMEVGDSIQTFEIDRISGIQFGSAAAAPAVHPADPPAPALQPRERVNVFRPDPASETTNARPGTELPAGTVLTVRMIDPVDSEVSRVGETFRASVDEPVVVGSDQVIPRGADVVVKLVDDKQSGKISGKTELTLDLVSVFVNGKIVDVNTAAVTRESSSRTSRSGKVIGGTTALGAIIGALAGGGKGAAIGAASGAGVGTAAQVATKGQRVHIPAETRLTFTLEYPVRI